MSFLRRLLGGSQKKPSLEEKAEQLNQRAVHLYQQGQYDQALIITQQAYDLARQYLGEGHPSFADSLNNLATLYYSMGDYAQAEPLYHQAMEIRRTALGEEHPDFADSLNNLAALYDSMGDYAQAEPLYRQGIEIGHTALGEEHPSFATSLSGLAVLYDSMGDYARAESLFRQALEIRRTTLGEKHPSFAVSLYSLGALYDSMGDYAQAEPLLRQAMEIWRTALGEEHPHFARSLNKLAMLLYKSMDDYAQAEPLLRQAMEIYRTVLGEEHPSFATNLTNLAALYDSMGDYAQAEPLYRQGMEILRTALGEEHPSFATSLIGLAALYQSMGDYTQAEPLYRQAMEIDRTTLGEDHPDFATSLNNLATLCAATERAGEALTLMTRVATIGDRIVGQVFSIGSENQRMAYLNSIQANTKAFLSLVSQYLADRPEAIQAGLDLLLRRKALGAEGLAVQRDAVLSGRYPELEPQLRQLTTLRRQIAQKTLAGPGPEGLEGHQQLLAEWGSQQKVLEAELARQIPEMNLTQKLQAVDWQAVAKVLPVQTVLVEFVRFDVFDFKAIPAQRDSRWQPARYLAFVLRAGGPNEVSMIDLGEAEPIEQMIAAFRATITGEDEHRGLFYGDEENADSSSDLETGQQLRAALFDPLIPALGDRRRLLLSPDGDLSRLPFEILPRADGRRLIDHYEFSYLSVGRDILRFGAASSGSPAQSVVIADPDFDLVAGQASGSDDARPSGFEHPEGRRSQDLDRAGLHFSRLPGTRVEGEQIAEMLKAVSLFDTEALESRLKRHPSPHILHIATHGFFLPDQKRDPNKEQSGFISFGDGPDASRLGRLAHGLENPLLRSGLALAGVNTWLKDEALPPEAEDGILTAEDVTGLDLLATELVVLSACETGLGEVQIGEGVFGLRRAFVLAGAKTLVMSLWKVPDQQTQELMNDFYRRILAGEPRAEALRQAQLEMKKKYPNPLYWGAFICQGDPGSLSEVD